MSAILDNLLRVTAELIEIVMPRISSNDSDANTSEWASGRCPGNFDIADLRYGTRNRTVVPYTVAAGCAAAGTLDLNKIRESFRSCEMSCEYRT